MEIVLPLCLERKFHVPTAAYSTARHLLKAETVMHNLLASSPMKFSEQSHCFSNIASQTIQLPVLSFRSLLFRAF
jgi:hypothetical protein